MSKCGRLSGKKQKVSRVDPDSDFYENFTKFDEMLGLPIPQKAKSLAQGVVSYRPNPTGSVIPPFQPTHIFDVNYFTITSHWALNLTDT